MSEDRALLHSTDRAEHRLTVIPRYNRAGKVVTMHADFVGGHAVGFPPPFHLVPDACSMLTRVYLAAPEGSGMGRAGLEHLLEHPGHC